MKNEISRSETSANQRNQRWNDEAFHKFPSKKFFLNIFSSEDKSAGWKLRRTPEAVFLFDVMINYGCSSRLTNYIEDYMRVKKIWWS